MRIDCIPQIGETPGHDLAGKTAIVMDVLRATSNIVTALANGASSVLPVETVAQAKQAAGEGDVLAGERQCRRIPGFDLGNSPLEYTEEVVGGRRIVMTTTNGTRGLQKASRAAVVMAGSLLNAEACAQAALQCNRDIVLLCAGTKDVFALEDGLCAGLIAMELRRISRGEVQLSDFAAAMAGAYASAAEGLEDAMMSCESGLRLSKLGFNEDVKYCAQRHSHAVVPVLSGGEMRPFSGRHQLVRSRG